MSSHMPFMTCDSPTLPRITGEVFRRSVLREEYCSLLVSRRRLERCDDPAKSQCRLFDVDSHELFVIGDMELLSAR